jgi:hypothetical protein
MATPNFNYVGNPDYRGYLSALLNSGQFDSQDFKDATQIFSYAGNDGGLDQAKINDFAGTAYTDPTKRDAYRSSAVTANDRLYKQFQAAAGTSTPAATGGTGGTNAADLAYLDDQEGSLRGILASAQKTLDNGRTQIEDSYGKETGRATASNDTALKGITTRRVDTTNDKQTTSRNVATNSRNLSDSVRRAISLASGTDSSAYKDVAPNAISRDATIKNTEVADTYGRNFRALDDEETSQKTSFEQLMQDLAEEKKNRLSGLESGVIQQQQSANADLADIARKRATINGGGYADVRAASNPYVQQVATGQSALDALFEKYRTPFAAKAAPVQQANLGAYNVDKTNIGATAPTAGTESPYASFLKKKFETTAA